jgi:hypothetical protein
MSSMRRQLPRPRTVRRFWDLSAKLSGRTVKEVALTHAPRTMLLAIQMHFVLPNTCTRRGCDKRSTARCSRCSLGYCSGDCQRLWVHTWLYLSFYGETDFFLRDWKDHKMVCGVSMETVDPAVRDEAFLLMTGPDGPALMAMAKAERGITD